MLKSSKKWPNLPLSGQFWLQSDFFCKFPPPIDFIPVGDRQGPENFESPHQKFREKYIYVGLTQRLPFEICRRVENSSSKSS